ncbi:MULTISPECIES: ROK family transcriptional regulator [unclassified Embleya]|uniref:ROK family transcriptional regulator n=1 Tax=unclassified Embleya TaxID=2699296 RepID=UPI0034053805
MAQATGGDSSVVRRINSAATLRTLRGGEVLTVTALMEATGLSRPTVEGVVDGLLAEGLVVETTTAESEDGSRPRGRPARRFRFHAEAGHLLGIDVGVHHIRVVLADLAGTIVGRAARTVEEDCEAEDRLERVRGLISETLRRAQVSRGSLWGVGVGTPGIVNTEGVVTLSSAMPGWTGLDLGGRLGRSFSCPIQVENDANLAAIGERWKGIAVGSDDIVYVMAGLSPGAGSFINGRLHRGFGGAAGEIGALHLLGRQVTPENLLSTTGTPLPPLDEAAVGEVFRHAAEGDRTATEAVDRFVQRLIHDVTALVLALDPEIVVIGGWAAGLADAVPPLTTELRRLCLRMPRVELSALGADGVALGAVRVALDRVEHRLFAVEHTGSARA